MRVPIVLIGLVALMGSATTSEAQAPESHRIGIALSGGGFRAAGFHLGALRKLDELGLLDELDVISCVSGGCIAAGVLTYHWTEEDRLDRLESYLTTSKWVAAGTVLSAILHPFKTRVEELADSYDQDLFQGATLSALGQAPRVYFNATNIGNGNRFFFSAGRAPDIPEGRTDVAMGDHETGRLLAKDVPIAQAVAASSAFPPVFNPLRMEHPELAKKRAGYVSLTDGGVYDNLGANPFLYDENIWPLHLDYVIVSDGGKPFAVKLKPPTSGTGVLTRMHSIQMEQIRGLVFQRLKERRAAGIGPVPLFFSIDSTVGEVQDQDADQASAIATDLKGLTGEEMEVLLRHGGALLEARIRKRAPELIQP
jgi:NTE family protein